MPDGDETGLVPRFICSNFTPAEI